MRGRAVDIQKVPGPMGGKVRKSAKMARRVQRRSEMQNDTDNKLQIHTF
jgi:hypothetical protein